MLILLTGKEEGFSLLEILIIMVIMATLVAINLPHFEGFIASLEERGQLRKNISPGQCERWHQPAKDSWNYLSMSRRFIISRPVKKN